MVTPPSFIILVGVDFVERSGGVMEAFVTATDAARIGPHAAKTVTYMCIVL